MGNGPVVFKVKTSSLSLVKWSIFTASFRKVVDGSVSINGTGMIQWNLQDKANTPVGNGIYYARIEVTGAYAYSRIWKIIVLR